MNLGSQVRDFVQWADEAELHILYSGEECISKEVLEYIRTELDVEGLPVQEDDDLDRNSDDDNLDNDPSGLIELLISQVAREIERRAHDAGDGYPFTFDGVTLELRSDVKRSSWSPYVFCLMVCDRNNWVSGDTSPKIFEHMASAALELYLQGSTVRFGAPRDTLPSHIEDAIDELARRTRTGDVRSNDNYPVQSTDQDLKLDVVGWNDFVDGQPSKTLVYMQCATGANWKGKRHELDLSAGGTWSQIMRWTITPVKALAIPYVVRAGEEWRQVTAGLLLFDRLRICSLLPVTKTSTAFANWSEWCDNQLKEVQGQHLSSGL